MKDSKSPQNLISPRLGGRAIVGVLVIVLLLGAVAATYLWQHGKYNSALRLASDNNSELQESNKNLAKASTLVTSLTKQISTLSTKNKQLQNQLGEMSVNNQPATQESLNLAVKGAEYVNPAGTVTQGGTWFGVDVSLTNNTSSTITVSNSSFQLQDSQGNQYPEETIIGASTLPAGWVSLNNPTIAPGQTVKGAVTFIMPNNNIKSFTFINSTRSYQVTSSN